MSSRYKLFISIFLLTINSVKWSYTYFAIEQCPGSDVPNIRHQTQFYEISMVFYYTEWSEDSLKALKQYHDVAEYFGDKIYFATVDCWHLACNCSRALTTTIGSGSPHKWPTLMLYYGRRGQLKIQYNGLYTFRDMLQFVENVMYPLERINSVKELENMKTYSDAVVLGMFKTSNDAEYKHFLIAALKWLEHDPLRTYRFTVTFENEIILQSNSDKRTTPNLYLMGHKTMKSFGDYSESKWNSTNILRWLHTELHDAYSLLHGYTTPIMIAQKLKKQPVLAIFVNQPKLFFSYMEKYVDTLQPFTKVIKFCQRIKSKEYLINDFVQSQKNSEIVRKLQMFMDNQICLHSRDILLKNFQHYYEINHYLNELFQIFAYPDISKIYSNVNMEVKQILKFLHTIQCAQKDIDLQSSLQIGVVKRLEAYLANEQQCCNSNRTLAVVLLDSQQFADYLAGTKMPVNHQSMANVFIADNSQENIYVMDDVFAMYNLMEFVKKFYGNGLSNYYKTEKIASVDPTTYDVEVQHLNLQMFTNNLRYSHNHTLVVLIYSPDCSLCGNIQHSFLQLSIALRHVPDLKFVRINVLDNDLPWQYNMPFLPALIVFPENRFAETRLFPMDLKPDVRNIFGFILSQLSPPQQIKLVLAACQSNALPKSHMHSCWQFAKTILMEHIGKHLHYWQMFESERNIIFERLLAFKDMSLDIQRNLRL